ncbi:MAG TPA: pyridoxal phosphate-dependent aminotransferase, partial [Lachnoclostridium sp.]|nr:pyridoxal phosphate-dependent aminotransferase [Lachnoclostridium sp.]
LLEKAGICLVAGSVFGNGGEGFIRMSFANSYENIAEGLRKLKEAVDGLMK